MYRIQYNLTGTEPTNQMELVEEEYDAQFRAFMLSGEHEIPVTVVVSGTSETWKVQNNQPLDEQSGKLKRFCVVVLGIETQRQALFSLEWTDFVNLAERRVGMLNEHFAKRDLKCLAYVIDTQV